MSRILNKFNKRRNPYAHAHGDNPEGFPSFQRSDEEAYLQLLLTNTLTGTFYATEKQLFDEALALHSQMVSTNPEFVARALVYARNEGLMRLQPIVGLAYLSKADKGLFRKIFSQVIRTPGDLADFVEIVRGGVVSGGMGRMIKTTINEWLNGLSEYHAIKYATGGQGYSLRDILRITHPKPLTEKQDAIFMWLTDRDKWATADELQPHTAQIGAFEQLKRLDMGAEDVQTSARQIIAEGRLPYEVVTGVIKPDVETWAELMRQMPYFALLRHLNTLQRAGVLQNKAHAEYVAKRLSDATALKRAKVLPFRLYTAHQMFQVSFPPEALVAEALLEAMDKAFANMPDLGGTVCIAPDVSGSMSGRINGRSMTRYIDIAGIFSGALLKKSRNALVLPFENRIVDVKLSRRDSLMTTADKLARIGGGGTAVSAPISHLLSKRIAVDTFIGITDNIEWATDGRGNRGFLPTWRTYKEKVAPQAKAFLITIAPYRHGVAPQDEPDVHYIYGWNDTVLKFITLTLEGVAGQVASVEKMDI